MNRQTVNVTDKPHKNTNGENRHSEGLSEQFAGLVNGIHHQIALTKGVLFALHEESNQLAAISVWDNGSLLDGLSITLPQESSLLAKLVNAPEQKVYDNLSDFPGNFFERKLLMDQGTGGIYLKPLFYKELLVGFLGLSAPHGTNLGDLQISVDQVSFNHLSQMLDSHLSSVNG